MNWIILLLIVTLLVAGCDIPPTPTPPPPATPVPTPAPSPSPVPPASGWQEAVDGLAALQRNLEIPEALLQEDAARTGEEFDVAAYFTVLDHLSMEPGYALDWVYYYEFMGGEPVLYARLEGDKPYSTFSEFIAARGEAAWPELRTRYLEHVRTDGTEEGYFQWLVLRLMGGQFYLFWHANYNDLQILAGRAALEQRVSGRTMFDQVLPQEVQEQARLLDATPTVEIGDATVQVSVLTFTHWGGFFRATYEIEREFPHRTVDVVEEELVYYDCGVAF